METAIVFIALIAAIFGIMYIFYSTRHRERLALIEKGADASLFNTGREGSKSLFNWSKFTLKLGMLSMGIAVGIVVGAILSNTGVLDDDAAFPSMIFFFGGMSLVFFYFFDRKSK